MSDSRKPVDIDLDKIKLKNLTRPVNEKEVRRIAASIRLHGLHQPIHVYPIDTGYGLAAGRHRVEAAQQLNWPSIPAFIISRDEARAWQWIENNDRYRIDPLSESIGIVESAIASEKLRSHVPKTSKGGKQPNDKGYSGLAKILGRSRKRVKEAFLHHGMPQCVRDEIYKNPHLNKRTELTCLAKLGTTDEQLAHIKDRHGPRSKLTKAKPKRSIISSELSMGELGNYDRLRKAYKRTGFKSKFEEQAVVVRRKFVKECLH